jgi:hypothetical protein
MGTHLLFNLEEGNRGAQFVAQNLKSLTLLWIRKQSSDLDDNNIGALGAIAIAKDLKNLTKLWIRKQ